MRSFHLLNVAGAVALGFCLGCSGSEASNSDDATVPDVDDVEVPTPDAAKDLAKSQITDSNFDEEYEKLLRDIEADEAASGKK
jgi:hypothetical protein